MMQSKGKITYIDEGANINTRNVDDVIARIKEKMKNGAKPKVKPYGLAFFDFSLVQNLCKIALI